MITGTKDTFSNDFSGLSGFLMNPQYRFFRYFVFLAACLAYIAYGATYYRVFITDNRVNIAIWTCLSIIGIGSAYLNIYLLIPRYLYRHRYTAYSVCLLGLIVLLVLSLSVTGYILDILYQSAQFLNTVQSLRVFIPLYFAFPMAAILFRRWYIHRLRIGQLENAAVQSELEQLKKQINPHFLFNMLNNANVLVKINPQEASHVLLKFKDLLNYQLTAGVNDNALLTDDIAFVNDFLNLEKIRRDRFEFTVTVDGNVAGVQIPPLLFIPFVENAVKHNPVSENMSYVQIMFRIKDGGLYFSCVNSKLSILPETSHRGGLGLTNVRRRLELLFPNRFSLEIINEPTEFLVDLNIRL